MHQRSACLPKRLLECLPFCASTFDVTVFYGIVLGTLSKTTKCSHLCEEISKRNCIKLSINLRSMNALHFCQNFVCSVVPLPQKPSIQAALYGISLIICWTATRCSHLCQEISKRSSTRVRRRYDLHFLPASSEMYLLLHHNLRYKQRSAESCLDAWEQRPTLRTSARSSTIPLAVGREVLPPLLLIAS